MISLAFAKEKPPASYCCCRPWRENDCVRNHNFQAFPVFSLYKSINNGLKYGMKQLRCLKKQQWPQLYEKTAALFSPPLFGSHRAPPMSNYLKELEICEEAGRGGRRRSRGSSGQKTRMLVTRDVR